MIERGDLWWVDLGEPAGAEPGDRRPVVVVQANAFNRSRLGTVLAVVLTSNLRLLDAPGNVLVRGRDAGLPRDSVADVSELVTLDRAVLAERAGRIPKRTLARLDDGLRLVLSLG